MQQFIELLEQMPTTSITPPTNTIGHVFRHEEKENFISDWLAFLLNPEYTGNSEPLSTLLQLAEVQSAVDVSDVSIVRESVLEDKRRIDFIIETGSHIIGIENKIWSDLQENQLKDYRKALKKKADTEKKKLVLILLYPQRNMCCKNLQQEELFEFKPVTYENLVSEFKHIRFNIFENLRATVLMEDFIIHMEEYIMSNSSEKAINFEMWHFEASYKKELQELQRKIDASKGQFGEYLKERMTALVSSREDCEAWASPSIHINSKESYYQLYKTSWQYAQVHFELLKKDAFPPSELEVVLHTRERGRQGKTDKLLKLGETIGKKAFPIHYETETAFREAMDKIFDELGKLITTYTEIIDTEIAAAATQK